MARVHASDVPELEKAFATLRDGSANRFELKHRLRHEDGAFRSVVCRAVAVHDSTGKPVRVGGSMTDVTEDAIAQAKIISAESRDALTGLLNRAAEVLKAKWPAMQAWAVEPTLSPVISGGQPAPHPIQGIGAGFIPANLHTQAIDGAIQVDPADAKEMARRCAREEGMLVGISSGATLAAIAQKLPDLGANARVMGFNYDTGERYLSVPDFLPE